ncbi:MAG: FAD-binding oxidoreductase [Pseudomonadales bacterium]
MSLQSLSSEQLDILRDIVGSDHVRLDAADLEQYGQDWSKLYDPQPSAIVLPKTTEQVQKIVSFANEQKIAITPSGGRTGLSAAATACNGELVIAFDRMNQILDIDHANQTVVCQAGVITEQLQQYAEQEGLFYPVDFASSGSSQIGGNISTNAGGIKVIRYGMTRNWVLGLKVVTANGEILELNQGLMKNNAGYDLRQLFIGAEGTLGLIVEATMKLTRPPKELSVLVLGVPEFSAIMDVLAAFQAKLDVTAFEFFSELALSIVTKHQDLQRPFETVAPFYALIEVESGSEEEQEKALEVFEYCVEQGWVLDGTMSQSQQQAMNLWRLREDISETLSQWTPYKNDLSVAVSLVPAFLDEVDAVVAAAYPEWDVVWYGHIGDGNVHLNILKPDDLDREAFKTRCGEVSQSIFELVSKFKGSVSAEHGVGLVKKPYLAYSRSQSEINFMRQIKQVFDPNGIMNPGKIFD